MKKRVTSAPSLSGRAGSDFWNPLSGHIPTFSTFSELFRDTQHGEVQRGCFFLSAQVP